MASLAILDEARAAGLQVTVEDDQLVVRGPRRLADLAGRVLASKAELLASLRQEAMAGVSPGGVGLPVARPPRPCGRPRRLIGTGFPPIPTTIPPESIVAKPRVACPACHQGAVLPELIAITGDVCYACWLKTNSPAPHSGPQCGSDESKVVRARDRTTAR